jgi:UDP-glucuronate 4-epimerase
MARVLVTGGVGFIGTHLTRELLARGDEVVVIDDFSDMPYPSEGKRRNARDLLQVALQGPSPAKAKDSGLRVVEACITDAATRKHFEGVERVFHLAALAGVRPSFTSPERYARVNVEGTTRVFELARAAGCKRFVFASSSSVYGNSTPLPAREDAVAIAPESPYAATKRGTELVVSALCRQAPDVRCAALRYFTVYGPRQRPEMAITLFTRAVLEGRPVTVFGDGTMRRDFTHVSDIVRGTLAASDRTPPGFRPYNLGSGAPVDLTSLVHAIGEAAGVKPIVDRAPQPLGDVDATFADIARAGEELGWTPRTSLRDGLASVVRWVRDGVE